MNFLLRLMAYLGLNATNYHVGLKRAESAGKAFASNVKRYFTTAFGAAALTAFATKIVNAADEILDMSDRLDISTKSLQEWIYAAKKSGAEVSNLTTFFESLAKARERLMAGDEQTFQDLSRLGVDMRSMQAGDFDSVGKQIGDALRNGNAKDLLPALQRIGGKGAGTLIPALKESRDLTKEANELGRVLDDAVLLKLKAIKKEFTEIGDRAMSAGAKILSKFGLPAAMMFADLIKLAAKLMPWKIGGALGQGGLQAYLTETAETIKREREQAINALRSNVQNRSDLNSAPSRASMFESGRVAVPKDRMFDALKMAGLRAILPSGDRPQLNEWQRLGAASRSTSDNKLSLISDHTKKAAEKLEILVRLNKGNLGAEENF